MLPRRSSVTIRAPRPATDPSSAQVLGQVSAQRAPGLDVERLIDRVVVHPHLRVIGKVCGAAVPRSAPGSTACPDPPRPAPAAASSWPACTPWVACRWSPRPACPRLAEYLPEASRPRPISRETVPLSNPIRTAIDAWVSLHRQPGLDRAPIIEGQPLAIASITTLPRPHTTISGDPLRCRRSLDPDRGSSHLTTRGLRVTSHI